ncbi:MAG: winged helix-turn-helix transcriptional regulator [Acidimicrobiia bacterium]
MTDSNHEWCPVEAALDLLSQKWMLAIIRPLLDAEMRFGELRTASRCPSPSTLTLRLRMLEAEGIVSRSVGPRVRYGLTEKGLGLGRVLRELGGWAEQWLVPRSIDNSQAMSA